MKIYFKFSICSRCSKPEEDAFCYHFCPLETGRLFLAANARCAENVKGKYLGKHKTNDIDIADSIQWRIFKSHKHEVCKSLVTKFKMSS